MTAGLMTAGLQTHLTLAGILVASLLGSWHCAGMCGPFGLFFKNSAHRRMNLVFYHFGHLFTYGLLALIIHGLAAPIRAKLGETVMIVILGAWVVMLLSESHGIRASMPQWLLRLTQKSLRIDFVGGFALGVATSLLPCVWLYGFLIFAAAESTWQRTVLDMAVFWLGTLPALTLAHSALFKVNATMGGRFRRGGAVLILAAAFASWYLHKGIFQSHDSAGGPGHEESCPFHQHH